jgi:hypothetical protein
MFIELLYPFLVRFGNPSHARARPKTMGYMRKPLPAAPA